MSTPLLTDPAPASKEQTQTNFSALLAWSATLFLSAFLLFQVQPILTKLILPWFGGAAAVWTTCLMFFQLAYLAGNLYAWWLGKQTPRTQSTLHTILMAASLLILPILPKAAWRPPAGANPTLYILGVLTTTIGLPFVILSATSPLLQSWYVRRQKTSQPYRFYALSNAGSFLALLSYPVLIEPYFTTRHQAITWSVAYAAFALCCATIAFRQRTTLGPLSHGCHSERSEESLRSAHRTDKPDHQHSTSQPHLSPSAPLQLLWVALAADAAALLLAITNHLSQNVAAVPMLWIIPLAIYLFTLILTFEGHAWYRRFFFLRLLAVALGGMTYALSPDFANAGPLLQVPLFCAGLFVCCMVCHGELEKLKPAHEHLTLFYLLLSAGGALGGIFVGVIAPWLFSSFYELPIALGACAILMLIVLARDPAPTEPSSYGQYGRWANPVFLLSAAVTIAIVISLYHFAIRQEDGTRITARNFYGVLRVRDLPPTDRLPYRRELLNGTIVHGIEILDRDRIAQPTTYYAPDSGAGMALLSAQSRGAALRVGIVGLGAGTLAGYGRAGDRFTFYEINPLVTRIAQSQFAFLRESKAAINIVPGDARLSLESEPPQNFDVLLVDAFSGDAIPIHLLTVEAFQLYLRQLQPNGVLAIHASNKYLDLTPIVDAAARALSLSTVSVINDGDESKVILTADWILIARTKENLPTQAAVLAYTRNPEKILPPWTDDYSNLLKILK